MTKISASYVLAKSLAHEGVEVIFHICGGPNIELTMECERLGIRLIDVRPRAGGRPRRHWPTPGFSGSPVCAWAPAGPATANMVPGVAHALADGVTPDRPLGARRRSFRGDRADSRRWIRWR